MICENCQSRPATERHHKFIQSKVNLRLYGRKLIDDPRNTQMLCYSCHHDKPVIHYSEKEFCEIMGIETRSKTGKL